MSCCPEVDWLRHSPLHYHDGAKQGSAFKVAKRDQQRMDEVTRTGVTSTEADESLDGRCR